MRTKKFFAMLLALCLVLSMVPAYALTANAATTDYCYTIAFTPNANVNWSAASCHLWSSTNGTSWPGKTMTLVDGVWYLTFRESWKPDNLIFNNNNGGQQTEDLTFAVGSGTSNKGSYVITQGIDYYLTGDFTTPAWGMEDDYKFTLDTTDTTAEHYVLKNVYMEANEQFKVRSADGWYPNGNNPYVTAEGYYDFTFSPDHDLGSYNGGYVSAILRTSTVTFDPNNGGQVTTEQVATGFAMNAPADPTNGTQIFLGWFAPNATEAFDFSTPITEDVTLTAQWGTVSYYLVGSMTNWEIDPLYELTLNGSALTEEYSIDIDLTASDNFKIASSADGVNAAVWYPAGTNNAYGENGEIVDEGDYTIYFRPGYDGGDDWFHNCIYALYVTHTVTFDPANGEATFTQIVPNSDFATLPDPAPTKGNLTLLGWFEENANEPFDFTTPISADVTLTAHWSAPTLADGYYIDGLNGWNWDDLDASMRFALNDQAIGTEYMLQTTLTAGQEFKVATVVNDYITGWAWAETGGVDNYVVDAAHAGNVTIYFRPNGDGGEGWHLGYVYVDVPAVQQEPTLYYDQVGFSVAGSIKAQFAIFNWNHSTWDYDSYYMIVKHMLADGTEELSAQIPLEVNDLGSGFVAYVGFYDVHAKYMADDLDVTVYAVKDGVTYEGPVSTTSIREIAADAIEEALTAATPNQARATVYADMLAYGAQAQLKFNYNTGDLANALTGDDLDRYNSSLSTGTPGYATLASTQTTPANMGTEKVTFYTTALSVEERVYLQFGLYFGAYDVDDFTIELKIGDRTVDVADDKLVAISPDYPGYYALIVDSIDAVESQAVVSVTVYEGATPVSVTRMNSIENLAASKDGDDAALASRMVHFYRSITALLTP